MSDPILPASSDVAPPPAPVPPATADPQAPYLAYPPATPTPAARPKTAAVIALALAAVGLVMAFIPFVTWFAVLPLLAAFIIGIVALASKKRGGKGFAIAAMGIAVVGWIVSIVVTIASFGMIGQAAIEESQRDQVSSEATSDSGDKPAADEAPTDARKELTLVETAFGQSS